MQTMSSEDFRAPPVSARTILLLAITAILTVAVWDILDAPFWTLYFSGLISAPFIVHAIRSHESVAEDGQRDGQNRPKKST